MLIIEAIVLGIIQGLTEFIPVSSSGHLIVIPQLFGWKDLGLSFDVALHAGTLVALLAFFGKDWARIISDFCAHVLKGKPYKKTSAGEVSGKLMIPIIIACIPAAVAGKLWENKIEGTFRNVILIAVALVIVSFIMMLGERLGKKKREIDRMNMTDYIVIGLAQVFALVPGVSRSGATITAGLFRDLDREAAAKFSFLLSTPIILGAALLKLKDVVSKGLPAGEVMAFIIGFVTAALVGYLSIKFLMNYLKKKTLGIFIGYRIVFAVAIACVFLLKK